MRVVHITKNLLHLLGVARSERCNFKFWCLKERKRGSGGISYFCLSTSSLNMICGSGYRHPGCSHSNAPSELVTGASASVTPHKLYYCLQYGFSSSGMLLRHKMNFHSYLLIDMDKAKGSLPLYCVGD